MKTVKQAHAEAYGELSKPEDQNLVELMRLDFLEIVRQKMIEETGSDEFVLWKEEKENGR